MSARPTWKGVLKVSLVNIPIKVYPATESSETLSFNQLHEPCQTRVTQRKWCAQCAREVASKEIVKGFEFEKGHYVVLLEDELEAVKPPSTRVIDVTQFASVSTLPLWAIDRAYYLAPDGDGGPSADAYALLVETMTAKVGIGTLAIYGREYLVAVSPRGGALMLYTLHHSGELREAPYTVDPTRPLLSAEVRLARQVIAARSAPLNLAAFPDAYQADVRTLIAAKIAGDEIVTAAAVDTPAVTNLRSALEQSLETISATAHPPAKAAPVKRQRAS
jgi:DNA end-binding protein Ku